MNQHSDVERMKLHILHRTRFNYATSVRESFNEARLQPVTAGAQVCHSFLLKILHSVEDHASPR